MKTSLLLSGQPESVTDETWLKVIADTNAVMDDLVSHIGGYPSLGSSFNTPSFDPLWLTYHRILKSWTSPGSKTEEEMDVEARNQWLGDDWAKPLYLDMVGLPERQRRVLIQARVKLNLWLKSLKFNFHDFDITSGETFTSAKGKTSVYQKLKDLRYWTVTADAADLACRLIYNNRGFRECARKHLIHVTTKEERKELSRSIPHSRNKGFTCFSMLAKKHLLTIVLGSRLETVPKDSDKRRTINVEPWFNVLLQRILGLSIRQVLSGVGNDLEKGQEDHKRLIANKTYATIDLRNASNSNLVAAVRWLLDPRTFSLLTSCRSEYCTYDGDDWHLTAMFSCMGNGFTFELMTAILLAVSRTLDPTSRVYGDDIIIKNRHAAFFIELLECLQWEVNEDKTFIQSSFRESCGAFYHDLHGYLLSYKFKRCESIEDCIIVANKLYMLRNQSALLRGAHLRVQSLFPAMHWGPVPFYKDNLGCYVWADKAGSGNSRLPVTLKHDLRKVIKNDYQVENFTTFYGVEKLPILASPTLAVVKKGNVFKKHFYLFNARRSPDVIRNEYVERFVLFVSFQGHPHRVKGIMFKQ